MKSTEDLKKIWLDLKNKFWTELKYEIKVKDYPNDILPWSKVEKHMRLFVFINWRRLSSWMMDIEENDEIFGEKIRHLEEQIEEITTWIKKHDYYDDLPF